MRAPEVFEGRPCVHRSQVWACAAMLLSWMKPGILGTAGNTNPLFHNSWCIAKIRQLFPDWRPSPINDSVIQAEFKLSEELIEDFTEIRNVSSLENEMQTVFMLPEVSDLLRRLFVVDSEKRLSAEEALKSNEFLALARKAQKRPK